MKKYKCFLLDDLNKHQGELDICPQKMVGCKKQWFSEEARKQSLIIYRHDYIEIQEFKNWNFR